VLLTKQGVCGTRYAQTVLNEIPLLASVAQLGVKGTETQLDLYHCITEQTVSFPRKRESKFKLYNSKWIPICMGMTAFDVGFDFYPFYQAE
jgi:hypothetical protein